MKRVGLFVGRMQPPTKAHISIIEKMASENEKCIIFLVNSLQSELNPFNAVTRTSLLEEIIPSNVSIVTLPNAFFIDYINEMDDENFMIYAGTDRIVQYIKFASYLKDGKTMASREISRESDDISATQVRESLLNNDIERFKELTDEKTHKHFDLLKESLEKQTINNKVKSKGFRALLGLENVN